MRLCDCNRVNFTTYRRGRGLSFFNLYTGMVGIPAQQCMRTVLRQFPTKKEMPDWSLTVSNNQRRQLNKKINDELHKTKGGIYIDAAHQLDCQGFWCFEGLHVAGSATDSGIYNGQLYTVLAVSENLIRLQIYNAEEQVDLNMCHIRNVKPAHAITYYSCQGRTLRGRVRLYIKHNKMTTTHLIVGLSRATCPTLIDCV